MNPANIESQNEREFGNTIAIGKNAGVVLECLTRSSSESLSKRSTAIAQISEDVLKIGCRWLAKLNNDLKASTGTARLCGGVLPGKFFFGFTEADSAVSCLRLTCPLTNRQKGSSKEGKNSGELVHVQYLFCLQSTFGPLQSKRQRRKPFSAALRTSHMCNDFWLVYYFLAYIVPRPLQRLKLWRCTLNSSRP